MVVPESSLVESIGRAMLAAVPQNWVKATLSVSAVTSGSQTSLDVSMADGSIDRGQSVDTETHFTVRSLREEMYQPTTGTWYNATFTLTPDGHLETDFDYDSPPYDGEFEDVILEDDQENLPRSQENLPNWHPSKVR